MTVVYLAGAAGTASLGFPTFAVEVLTPAPKPRSFFVSMMIPPWLSVDQASTAPIGVKKGRLGVIGLIYAPKLNVRCEAVPLLHGLFELFSSPREDSFIWLSCYRRLSVDILSYHPSLSAKRVAA